MRELATVFAIVGRLQMLWSLTMLLPIPFAIHFHNTGDVFGFSLAAAITFLSGLAMAWFGPKEIHGIKPKQIYLTTAFAWLFTGIFGALPFVFSVEKVSVINAIFESISGLTTTGSTIFTGIDFLPKDIMVWRSITQWVGGIGIVGTAVAVFPFLKVGGMKLFQSESSEWSETDHFRARRLSVNIFIWYMLISLLTFFAYWHLGMDAFNAFNHAMTTVSTGGFSTSDASFGQFSQPSLMLTSTLCMMLGSVPFALYHLSFSRRRPLILRNSQVQTFILVILLSSLLLTINRLLQHNELSFSSTFITVIFNIVSVITTTGFASEDYSLWGSTALIIFFFLTFSGGCSGSTAGGIKIFRFQILGLLLKQNLEKAVHPNSYRSYKYNDRILDTEIVLSTFAFFILVGLSLAIITLILSISGLDMMTSLTGTMTALMNVGPGLGDIIGPAGNFSSLTDFQKSVLAFAMLLGRLEFITILVLFTRRFWSW